MPRSATMMQREANSLVIDYLMNWKGQSDVLF